jgi:uncharacterized protein (TIGR04255 family)
MNSLQSLTDRLSRMNKWPRLPNPPITEALLDIRCKLPVEIHLDSLAVLHDAIRDRYPNKRQRKSYRATIEIKPEGKIEAHPPSGEADGFLFSSADGRQIVQVRLDGFTFNRLKPYDRWEALRDEAKVHWRAYAGVARPEVISRIALRYINRIEVPISFDFKEYILTTPEIAPGLPQGLSNFLMRLVVPDPRSGSTAIITETMEPPKDDRLPLILDIDSIRETIFDPRSEDFWEVFEQLHDFAIEIFFRTVTDKAKELFR